LSSVPLGAEGGLDPTIAGAVGGASMMNGVDAVEIDEALFDADDLDDIDDELETLDLEDS
jgi:hypothetical protein